MKVAIVGAGPKGLFAAERLIAQLATGGGEADITLFDPQPPGWGAGYRPDQPAWLRLNVNAAIVAADGGAGGRPSLGLPSFADWRRRQGETDPLDEFPPRAAVGRYLMASWSELVNRLPPGVMLRHRTQRVSELSPDAGGWLLVGERYHEVLLCTGHAHDWPGALQHGWPGPAPLVPQVYPVRQWLTQQRVPPGSTVVCRGAALTFIDAALGLTEGRGGRFEADGYRASGAEPGRIVPVGRRGGFLQVKPDPRGPLATLDLSGPRAEGLRACAAATGDLDRLLAVVWGTAADYLAVATGGRPALPPVGSPPPPPDDPVAGLRRSLQVALGQRPPGVDWALGQAWRDLYPAIVEAAGLQRLPHTAWPRFAAAAAALEPVAFGVPPVNAAKLLALCEAGVVDTGHLAGDWTQIVRSADVVIDCVLPPAGLVTGEWPDELADRGLLIRGAGRRGVAVGPDASCLTATGEAVPGLSALGRLTEDVVIGNDTLSRTLHPAAQRWAQRVAAGCAARLVPGPMTGLRDGVHGEPPLSGRLEPWMTDLLNDPAGCAALLQQYGSPVNVIDPAPLRRNADELIEAGRRAGVPVGLFFARKANKALSLVDAVLGHGHGVDVASETELRQVLQRGATGERIILSAAVKPEPLLRLALQHGVTISLDSPDEAAAVAALARDAATVARVAPRLAPPPTLGLPPTRFGDHAEAWLTLPEAGGALEVVGVHFHLHGYRADDRGRMLGPAIELVAGLRERGHRPGFVDIGGGVPISYLDDAGQWEAFWAAHRRGLTEGAESITWKNRELRSVYPFHQSPVRGEWLRDLLAGPLADGTVADALRAAGLALHLEPGRALLDGCGLTLARVAFVKRRSDGVGLVGLEMNRTQCRSTSDDFLVDPILVRTGASGRALDGFLVGTYCIEDELILLRRMHFRHGVAVGDVLALPNTGGYLMHILESASHQIPLARNVVRTSAGDELDPIDCRPDAGPGA